jgi:threonine synthase
VIHETNGFVLDVTEAEIAIAKAELGREGIGCEPASAVTLAGLKKLMAHGKIAASDTVVLLLTGHTLKDADYTIDFHRGALLSEAETAQVGAEIEPLRRNAIEVKATPEAVLKTLEEFKSGWVPA